MVSIVMMVLGLVVCDCLMIVSWDLVNELFFDMDDWSEYGMVWYCDLFVNHYELIDWLNEMW